MQAFTRCMAIAGMVGAMACAPSLMAQDRDRDQHDQGSEQEAIRFEKAKQAAADRQQRIEDGSAARQPRQKALRSRRTEAETKRHQDSADRTETPKGAPVR